LAKQVAQQAGPSLPVAKPAALEGERKEVSELSFTSGSRERGHPARIHPTGGTPATHQHGRPVMVFAAFLAIVALAKQAGPSLPAAKPAALEGERNVGV
jgi:hypothetical protein